MIVLEKDAPAHWCPFSRVGNDAGCNRNGQDFPASPTCVGSLCMAWREETALFHAGWSRFLQPGEQYQLSGDVAPVATGRGYCGLAGQVSA